MDSLKVAIDKSSRVSFEPVRREIYINVKVIAEGPTRVLIFEEQNVKTIKDNKESSLVGSKKKDTLNVEYIVSFKVKKLFE